MDRAGRRRSGSTGSGPTSKALAARLAAFWLPSQTVLYIGASEPRSAGGSRRSRATELGDRRPLRRPLAHDAAARSRRRVWWAATAATEEYEDALLAAFADGVAGRPSVAGSPDRDVVLPLANLRRPTGERKATGLTGSLLAEPWNRRARRPAS